MRALRNLCEMLCLSMFLDEIDDSVRNDYQDIYNKFDFFF